MATSATGILTADATPAVARRAWPQWLALGLGMLAVAVTSLLWDAAGARLLLGALGAFLAVRGGVLLGRAGELSAELSGRARGLGVVSALAGLAGLAVAVASADLAARVLLVAVPLLLLGAAAGLLARGGLARRGGQALLVWSVLVAGLLVATGLAQGWDRASAVATVVSAVAVAVLAVPVLVGAANLRAVGARPDAEEGRPLGCAGCACSGGGCGV
ncbi:hypothetical protein GCM10010531_08620 [Blastococcus jejuensis]|uniref:Uncharacterized protein n=1 Tax=Blastococcus jejuensis TaxID=351224 RepID=A0ABP6NX58_9ACTN